MVTPQEFYSEYHFGSQHDFDPHDIHFSDSGNIDAYIYGYLSPQEPFIGPLITVNPAESPPTGWGAPNHQQFQTGHTQNIPTNESAEQGMGVGPERRWPHYPHAENPNVFRNLNVFQRAGTDTYTNEVYRAEAAAFWYQALIDSVQHAPDKQRSPVNPVINQAPSVPFVDSIPPLVDY
jgi:hypothetical protein